MTSLFEALNTINYYNWCQGVTFSNSKIKMLKAKVKCLEFVYKLAERG